MINIKKLHHSAYRCQNTLDTKKFYVDFLGLEFTKAFIINTTKSKRETKVLHSFYTLQDGSSIAFFEDPNTFFDFKDQHDFDLHIAFEVSNKNLKMYIKKAKILCIETRGISDHGFIKSVYFRDPNGYVIELTVPTRQYPVQNKGELSKVLEEWKNLKIKKVY